MPEVLFVPVMVLLSHICELKPMPLAEDADEFATV